MARIPILEACQRLMSGDVVAIPTETVYGLAASIAFPQAIERVFALKGRPSNNPLIVHVAEVSDLDLLAAQLPPFTHELTRCFWPGPLTLVLPAKTQQVPPQVRGGLATAAFRMPNHDVALDVLRQTGPLVAPSANLSGLPSATCPEHVEEDFGDAAPVVDGGQCSTGLESTILAFHEGLWRIARLGALAAESFQEVLGYTPGVYQAQSKAAPLCPGSLYRHYAPQARLTLGEAPYAGEAPVVIGFSDRAYPGAIQILSLGSSASPEEPMHRLYEVLRRLDRSGIAHAWVDLRMPQTGLWRTLRERLTRAAGALTSL